MTIHSIWNMIVCRMVFVEKMQGNLSPTYTAWGHLNFDKIEDVIQITIEDVVWVVV